MLPTFTRTGIIRSVRTITLSTVLATGSVLAQSPEVTPLTSDDRRQALKAVQNTLPSVAVLGQKRGPSDTIEVFIQVPGVLNMQSVYVLSDRQSVLSGIIIPPIEGSYPGGQLELPDGKASMNPRAQRKNMQAMNSALGLNVSPSPQSKAVPPTPNIPSPTASAPAQTANAPVPVSTQPVQQSASLNQPVVPSPSRAKPSMGAQSDASTSTASQPSAAQGSADVSVAADPGGRVISSLSDVSGDGVFGAAVRVMIEKDQDIGALRNMTESPKQQQKGFLDIVKSLPAAVQGDSPRKVYVMFDPNCPVCHRYYAQVDADVRSGNLEVHWIPAIVFPNNRSSLTASAALIAELDRGGDVMGMLDSMMTDSDFNARIDRSPGADKLVPYLDPVVKNTAIMSLANAATPLVIFENEEEGLIISPGIPERGYISLIKPTAI